VGGGGRQWNEMTLWEIVERWGGGGQWSEVTLREFVERWGGGGVRTCLNSG